MSATRVGHLETKSKHRNVRPIRRTGESDRVESRGVECETARIALGNAAAPDRDSGGRRASFSRPRRRRPAGSFTRAKSTSVWPVSIPDSEATGTPRRPPETVDGQQPCAATGAVSDHIDGPCVLARSRPEGALSRGT